MSESINRLSLLLLETVNQTLRFLQEFLSKGVCALGEVVDGTKAHLTRKPPLGRVICQGEHVTIWICDLKGVQLRPPSKGFRVFDDGFLDGIYSI